jgi:ferredoxin
MRKKTIKIIGEMKRVDERDIIFSRFDYREGTKIFDEYYKTKPEYKEKDNEIRKIPDILSSQHIEKKPSLIPLAAAEFEFLEHLLTQVNGDVLPERLELSPLRNTQLIKRIARYLGADDCGLTQLNQNYIYSHVGRGPEPYGEVIECNHPFAITFAVEMDLDMIHSAPLAPVIVETGKKYVEAARISIILANYIRRLGYPARAHIAGSNYQCILPPLAAQAGLGELGRLGILITEKFGPRARLGLVTTGLPLIPDETKLFGIQNFCEKCQKCARNCPSQAIPYGEKTEENGVLKWTINREECYRFWRKAGTDCAICIAICPYSKTHNTFHGFIRKLIGKSSLAQSFSIWGDDLFYGRFLKGGRESSIGL